MIFRSDQISLASVDLPCLCFCKLLLERRSNVLRNAHGHSMAAALSQQRIRTALKCRGRSCRQRSFLRAVPTQRPGTGSTRDTHTMDTADSMQEEPLLPSATSSEDEAEDVQDPSLWTQLQLYKVQATCFHARAVQMLQKWSRYPMYRMCNALRCW